MPPRLPPRSPSKISTTSDMKTLKIAPNSNSLTPQVVQTHPYTSYAGLNDPRSSSTQSLHPVESAGPNRRTLFIVYIHGFMGNETSFRSFPAHVHSLLTETLAESHVVYSKIYPRYQSRKNISFARDAFSNWLAPHESDTTDVILVGHSLGGILGAEVVLLPSHTPDTNDVYQHRILGLIAFDTPFLGMHPGVVSTGIASLFRGAPDTNENGTEPTSSQGDSSDWRQFNTTPTDPNFNPTYTNDVNLPVRSNKWEKAWYFLNKHAGELRKATQSYVKSHLEFGGCLADYPGLKRRYDAVRLLEDIDEMKNQTNGQGRHIHRVRFVNYYTASTGRIKEQASTANDNTIRTETEMQSLRPESENQLAPQPDGSRTPRLSLSEHQQNQLVDKTEELQIDQDSPPQTPLTNIDPHPFEGSETEKSEPEVSETAQSEVEATDTEKVTATSSHNDLPSLSSHNDLPSLPAEPTAPVELDESKFTDPDALRLAKKDYARQLKTYEKTKKDRQKAIKDREKVIAKRERQVKKEQGKAGKMAQQDEQRSDRENVKRQSTINIGQQDKQMRDDAKIEPSKAEKRKRDRKFCSLPSKDDKGQRDPTWIRVYMQGMDEVVAHTSLFFVSDTYARLVGDTAERIEQWVKDDATTRMLLSEYTAVD